MILLYGSVPTAEHLIQFSYLPADLGRTPGRSDHVILFVGSSFFADSEAMHILDSFPFKTILIEADNGVYTKYISQLPVCRAYGGRAVRLTEKITFLLDCGIYTVEGKRLLVFPFCQAKNTASDKLLYERHCKMRRRCRKLLEQSERSADHIISSLIPFTLAQRYRISGRYDYNSLLLDRFLDTYTYKRWYYTYMKYDTTLAEKYINVFRGVYVIE